MDENKFEMYFRFKGRTQGFAPTRHGCIMLNTKYSYNRRSIRLPYYDYSKDGYYFVTICTYGRFHLFGEIVENEMILNKAGEMLQHWHHKLEDKFPHIKNHEMIIMPNHIHFIIEITKPVGTNPRVRPSPKGEDPKGTSEGNLGRIIQWFKTMSTNAYIHMVKEGTLPSFEKRIWQRNYHEHVIRNDADYLRVAEYTVNNPSIWEDDIFV